MLTGQSLDRGGTIRWTRDYGAAMRLAEQEFGSREPGAESRQVNVQTEPVFLIRTTHRHFSEGNG